MDIIAISILFCFFSYARGIGTCKMGSGDEGQWRGVRQLTPLEATDRIWEEEGPVTIGVYVGHYR